jgi:hypothetical protein
MSIRNMNPAKGVYNTYLNAPQEENTKPLDTSGGLMRSVQKSMQSTEKNLDPKQRAIGLFKSLHEARMRHKNGRTA